ncbi:MAG: lysylphosphatidylglycerol synthase transmembrane domain-containing protein [Candidatus Binatia bacterium]
MRPRDGLFLGLGLTGFALLAWQFGFAGVAMAFERLRPPILALYAVAAAAVYSGYTLRWLLVSRALGSPSGFGPLLAARLSADAVGSLLPTTRAAGDPLRVALVAGPELRGTLATACVATDRILELIGNIFAVIVYLSLFSLLNTAGEPASAARVMIPLMLFLLVALAVPLIMLGRGLRPLAFVERLAARRPGLRLARFSKLVTETEDHLVIFFREHPAVFMTGLMLSLAVEATIVLQYWLLLAAFGIDVEPTTLLVAIALTGAAHAVPTPAGLGALEGAQVTLFAATAGQPALGFVVAVVMRMHETLWIGIGLAALGLRGVPPARLWRNLGKPAGELTT